MTDKNMEKKITELKELKALEKELTAEIKELEDELKQEMTNREITDLSVGIHSLRYKPVTSRRFDSKAFKADYGDIYELYSRENVSMRFTVA